MHPVRTRSSFIHSTAICPTATSGYADQHPDGYVLIWRFICPPAFLSAGESGICPFEGFEGRPLFLFDKAICPSEGRIVLNNFKKF
jgi:hypothetical protein